MLYFTGYFAKANQYLQANLLPVAVSVGVPNGWQYPQFKSVAPAWDLVQRYKNGITSVVDYTREYLSGLTSQTIDAVLKDCQQYVTYGHYDGVVLCCYESPEKFCHRHLLADFINDNFDISIDEYTV